MFLTAKVCEKMLGYDGTCLGVVRLLGAEEIPHIIAFFW